jgi:hypothetical protein
MTGIRTWRRDDGLELVRMESGRVRLDVAPGLGGRIVSLVYQRTGYEHLRDEGISELIQGPRPEGAGPASWPQHGELGALPLEVRVEGISVLLRGVLPACGLHYERRLSVDEASPQVHVAYHISNPTGYPIRFAWAIQAALRASQGDHLLYPAGQAQAAEPSGAAVPLGQGADSLCLGDLQDGWLRVVDQARTHEFGYRFDHSVFPYVWYRGSSSNPTGDFTAVVGPGTAIPAGADQAAQPSAGVTLEGGQDLRTRVVIYAGPARRGAWDIAY